MADLHVDRGLPITVEERDRAGNLDTQMIFVFTSSDESIVKVEKRSYGGVVGDYVIPQGPLGTATITATDQENPIVLTLEVNTLAGDPTQEGSSLILGVGIPLDQLLPV